MSYVMAPFSGCTAVCEKDGVAFALGLFDPWNQGQTDTARSYLAKNDWTKIEEISPFVLFYWNGADRPGEVYWKEIKKGEELSFPAGMILCYKRRYSRVPFSLHQGLGETLARAILSLEAVRARSTHLSTSLRNLRKVAISRRNAGRLSGRAYSV